MTPPDLPVPIIDHVIVNARDALDDAATTWTRLGFQLTPRGHHTLGSSNHLAILGTDYIELLGVQPGATRTDVLDWPAGLNGLVFKTLDSDATHRTLAAAGAPVLPPQAFSRPVDMGAGDMHDAAFRTVRIEREASPAGRMFFCHHLTPGLVWHDPWRRHPNGALGIAAMGLTATDPEPYAALFLQLFGPGFVQRTPVGVVVKAGLVTISVERGARDEMAVLALRTASLDMARAALRAGGIDLPDQPGRVVVPPGLAGNVTLLFLE